MTTKEQSFGAIIRALREEKRIGLRQFAKMLGMSATYLSKIERDELAPPAEERVKEIARLLERDPDELLALAGKVDSELNAIIRNQPRQMASFLRMARDFSGPELEHLTKYAEKRNKTKS